MTRGRKPNFALEPSRQLQTQRAFRERKAAHLLELESTVKRQASEVLQLKQKLLEANKARLIPPSTSTTTRDAHCENCLPTDRHNAYLQRAVASLEQQVVNLQSSYAVVADPLVGPEGGPSSASSSSYYGPSYDDPGSAGSFVVSQSQSPFQRNRDYAPTPATSASSSYHPIGFAVPSSSRGHHMPQMTRLHQTGPARAFSYGAEHSAPWSMYSQSGQQMPSRDEARSVTQSSVDEQPSALKAASHTWQSFRREIPQQQRQLPRQQSIRGDIVNTSQGSAPGTLASAGCDGGNIRGSINKLADTSLMASSDQGARQEREASRGREKQVENEAGDDCCLGIFECDPNGRLIV